jgi:hypothetical protein
MFREMSTLEAWKQGTMLRLRRKSASCAELIILETPRQKSAIWAELRAIVPRIR